MAHEVEIRNGKANMAYAGETPWHGLGKNIPENLTPAEILVEAGLDWKVNKMQTFIEGDFGNGIERKYAGVDALVRDIDGSILDTVGENWKPVQNDEAFDFFDDFVRKGNVRMDVAGSLKKGRIVFALAKIEKAFEVFKGDEITGYMLLTNPHQFGKSISVRTCMTRVVCQNTLTAALREKSKNVANINHRSRFDAERVKAMLGIADHQLDRFKEAAQFIGSKKYKKSDLVDFYGQIFGVSEVEGKDLSRNGQLCMDLIETQPGAHIQEGTFWSAFNSVTYFIDHVAGRSNDTRLESAWYGVNATKKQQALDLALEMAKVA